MLLYFSSLFALYSDVILHHAYTIHTCIHLHLHIYFVSLLIYSIYRLRRRRRRLSSISLRKTYFSLNFNSMIPNNVIFEYITISYECMLLQAMTILTYTYFDLLMLQLVLQIYTICLLCSVLLLLLSFYIFFSVPILLLFLLCEFLFQIVWLFYFDLLLHYFIFSAFVRFSTSELVYT